MQSPSTTESASESDSDIQTVHTPVESAQNTTKKSSGKRSAVSAGKYSPFNTHHSVTYYLIQLNYFKQVAQ